MSHIIQNNTWYLNIGILFKWLMSKTPYLIHDTTKTPHITGSGVLLVVYGLKFRKQREGKRKHSCFLEKILAIPLGLSILLAPFPHRKHSSLPYYETFQNHLSM